MITMKPHICWEKDYPNSLNVVIGKVLWSSRGDWGTVAALGVIGFLLFLSVSMTVASDLGYVADAFT